MLIFFKLNLESDIWKIEPEDTNDENIKEELKKYSPNKTDCLNCI